MAAAIYIIWRRMVIQYIVPIVALFQGRVIDHPGAMVETKYSTEGDVEHEVSTWFDMCGFCNGCFGRSPWPAESSSWSSSLSSARQIQMLWPNCSSSFYVRHPTVYVSSFLILQPATAETNKSIDSKGMRIYGLLTNLFAFKFYSYDPSTNQFYFDETICSNAKRTTAFADMIDGTSFCFFAVT